jgi:hypothetical protein
MKQINHKSKQLLKAMSLFVIAASLAITGNSQAPSVGTTGFNNSAYDQIPLAFGSAAPTVLSATNVASTGFNFYIGAIGLYQVIQTDYGTSSYNGAISATNVTPGGSGLYQSFAFTSTNFSRFKLNSVKVRVNNSSFLPVPMVLAGTISGANSGDTVSFLAYPGSNWYTINTSTNANFYNINGVVAFNITGTTNVAEMAFDDINIAAAINVPDPPTFISQPTNRTICAGETATFNATASATASTYYWIISPNGITWNKITAATSGATFSGFSTNTLRVIAPTVALNNYQFALVAINSAGGHTGSNAVKLFVNAQPAAPAISGSASVCAGLTTALSSTTNGGVWSSLNNRATVNASSGLVTGVNAGAASIKYTVTSGGCSNSSTYAVTVSNNTIVPTISYAAGTVNPQSGATGGGFCTNRTFTLEGSPSGGTWSKTGVITIGAISGFVNTGTTPGVGSVTYTYANAAGCTNSRTINGTIVACAARGINGLSNNSLISNESSFNMYPNPAKNFLNINIKTLVGEGQIIVTDLMGKEVKKQALSMGNNNIDIANLGKGFYMVSIVTSEGKSTKKLIVE